MNDPAGATRHQPLQAERLVWDEATTRRLWDYYAGRPELYFTSSLGPAIVRQLGRRVAHKGRALDYGCGTGGLIQPLLAAGMRVGAVDANATVRGNVGVRFRNQPGFLGVWPPDEAEAAGPFDLIYFVEVIEHLDDAALAGAFATMRGLLAPGGWLVCTTPNEENLEAAMVFCPVSGKVFHPMQHVRSWTAGALA